MYEFDFGELMRLSADSNIQILAVARHQQKRRRVKELSRRGHRVFSELHYDEALGRQTATRGPAGPESGLVEPTDIAAYRALRHPSGEGREPRAPNAEEATGVLVPLMTEPMTERMLALHALLTQHTHPDTTPPPRQAA